MVNRILVWSAISAWRWSPLPGDPLRLPGQGAVGLLPGVGRPRLRPARTRCRSGARSATVFSRRQARYGTLAATSVLVVLGILVAINYIGARQNKRWDLTATKQFSLSDQSRNVLAKLDAPLQVLVFSQEQEFPRYQRQAEGIRVRVQERHDRVHRSRQEADGRASRTRSSSTARSSSTTRGAASASRPTPSRTSRTASSRSCPASSGRSISRRATARRTRRRPNATATTRSRRRSAARTTPSTKLAHRTAGVGARRCLDGGRRRAADRLLPAGNRGAEEVPRQGRQAAPRDRPAGQGGQPAADQPDRARPRLGRRRSATTSSST